MSEIIICTLGGFDIFFGDVALSDTSIRRGKAWIALKFLIAHYKRSVSTEELISTLWADNDCVDPLNSLKNIIYRLRKLLAEYNRNIQYISFFQGMYSWNPNVKWTIDVADFENFIGKARDGSESIENRIIFYKEALALYRGEFLRGEGNELWLMNFINYYRRLYLSAINELAKLYEQYAAFEEIAFLYSEAVKIEPYEESLYICLIQTLINIGDYTSAKQQYQNIERLLKKDFDASPSLELQSLLLEIGRSSTNLSVDLSQLKINLDNDIVQKNAIFCGPETFRRIYSYDKYLDERVQFPVILGLVTIQFDNDSSDNDNRLREVTKTLRQIMIRTLRQCDIICQYSANQFVLMLTGSDKNHKMTSLNRIGRLFNNELNSKGVTLHLQAMTMEEHEFKDFNDKL